MSRQIRFSPNVLIQSFGTQAVVLNLNNETYYALNEVALRMWELLTSSQSEAETLRQLYEEFEADPAVLRQDLEEFILALEKLQVIEIIVTPS